MKKNGFPVVIVPIGQNSKKRIIPVQFVEILVGKWLERVNIYQKQKERLRIKRKLEAGMERIAVVFQVFPAATATTMAHSMAKVASVSGGVLQSSVQTTHTTAICTMTSFSEATSIRN